MTKLTREEVEMFRSEHRITAHVGEAPEAGIEPWAAEHNRVLDALCDGALQTSAPEGVTPKLALFVNDMLVDRAKVEGMDPELVPLLSVGVYPDVCGEDALAWAKIHYRQQRTEGR